MVGTAVAAVAGAEASVRVNEIGREETHPSQVLQEEMLETRPRSKPTRPRLPRSSSLMLS